MYECKGHLYYLEYLQQQVLDEGKVVLTQHRRFRSALHRWILANAH